MCFMTDVKIHKVSRNFENTKVNYITDGRSLSRVDFSVRPPLYLILHNVRESVSKCNLLYHPFRRLPSTINLKRNYSLLLNLVVFNLFVSLVSLFLAVSGYVSSYYVKS